MANGGVLEVGAANPGRRGRGSSGLRSARTGPGVSVSVRLHLRRASRDEPLGGGPRAGDEFGASLASRRAPGRWLCPRRVPSRGLVQRVPHSLARPANRSRVGRRRLRPVLKHGPRSLTRARVAGLPKPSGVVKAKAASSAEGRSPLTRGAVPALRVDLASCGAARAHALGPERW